MSQANFNSRSLRSLLLIGSASMVLGVGAPAFAQDEGTPTAAPGADTVTVTGSRIRRSDFTAESPVTVVSGQDINEAGNLNLGEVLRNQIGVGTVGGFNQSSNLSGGGAQSVDLRNLGTDRVLTLINGKRVASFADALQNEADDLSFIPLAMVERIEILRDGASSVYGADAVTGVINVILRDDFEGMDFRVQTGISEHGDAESYSAQAVFGANFDRGNVVISGEYRFSDDVPQRNRDWAIPSISALGGGSITNGSGAHPGGLFFNTAIGYFWCTQPVAFGGDEATNVFGTTACPAQAPSNPSNLIGRYDYALVQSILNQQEVFNFAAYGTFDLTSNVEAFMEAQISHRLSESKLDGNPIFEGQGSPAFPSGWVVNAGDNPNITALFPAATGDTLVRIRPTSTIGSRDQFIEANMFRSSVGLRGTELFGMFDWELSYLWTRVSGEVTTDATFNLARAIRISNASQCALDPNCVAAVNPTGALNVLQPSTWLQSEIDYMKQIATSNSDFDLDGVFGVMSGEIFDLPAGGLGVAFGFEYREEGVDFKPDAVTAAGESIANQTFATNGSFDSKEIFGEVNIPILADVPFFLDLSVNLQGRWFDYSNFGDDTVYKVGLNWAMFEDIRARATYGTSFRAPTLVDAFSGGTVSFDFIDDPCDAANPELIDPVRAANCALALGALFPGFTQAAPQLPVLAGGDIVDGTLDLDPETSVTWTVGIVLTPSFLEGFNASVDYWSIEVENFIGSVDTENEVLDVCYDSPGLAAPECALFTRNPLTGNLQGLTRFPVNRAGTIETNGLDWALAYTFGIFNGDLTLSHQGTYIFEYNLFPGEGNCGSSSGVCVPEYRLNFGAEWAWGDWTFGLNSRYVPSMENVQVVEPNFLRYTGPDATWVHDLRVRWDMTEEVSLLAGVNHLGGEDPPYVFNTGNNTDPGLYGSQVIGRYYFMRLETSF